MAPLFIGPVVTQQLSFCYTMVSYINTHRTAAAHGKLIQTCKEFFVKKPAAIVEFVSCENNHSYFLEYQNERFYA